MRRDAENELSRTLQERIGEIGDPKMCRVRRIPRWSVPARSQAAHRRSMCVARGGERVAARGGAVARPVLAA